MRHFCSQITNLFAICLDFLGLHANQCWLHFSRCCWWCCSWSFLVNCQTLQKKNCCSLAVKVYLSLFLEKITITCAELYREHHTNWGYRASLCSQNSLGTLWYGHPASCWHDHVTYFLQVLLESHLATEEATELYCYWTCLRQLLLSDHKMTALQTMTMVKEADAFKLWLIEVFQVDISHTITTTWVFWA